MPTFRPFARTEKSKNAIEMDKDENGQNILTEKYIIQLCEENGQYTTPKLNDTLYLHFKQFKKIQNLHSFINVKTLWLECNGIEKIEGLDSLVNLKMLHLQQNYLKKIQNLNHLSELVSLNLSNNCIKVIEGLKGLNKLKRLELNSNHIEQLSNCEELKELPKLEQLELQNNQIDDRENVVQFFSEIHQLSSLQLKGNPCVRYVMNYRKSMMRAIPNLFYLDEKPLTELERKMADAWAIGGQEEEQKAKSQYLFEQEQKKLNHKKESQQFTEDNKLKRKMIFQKMLEEVKEKQIDLLEKRDKLNQEYHQLQENENKKKMLQKIKFINDELKGEVFDALEEHGMNQINLPKYLQQIQYSTDELDKLDNEPDSIASDQDDMENKENQIENLKEEQMVQVESEFQKKMKNHKVQRQIKWNDELEQALENILVQNQFDFNLAAVEFKKLMDERNSEPFKDITAKTLQVKWTDIEIKKYRLNDASVGFVSESNDLFKFDQIDLNPTEQDNMNQKDFKDQIIHQLYHQNNEQNDTHQQSNINFEELD